MQITTEIDFEDIEYVNEVGDCDGVFTYHDLMMGRQCILNEERSPNWLFVDHGTVADLMCDNIIREFTVTVETILRNVWISDFEEAVKSFNTLVHPDASALIFGMNVVETKEVSNLTITGNSYSSGIALVAAGEDVPDMDCTIAIKY